MHFSKYSFIIMVSLCLCLFFLNNKSLDAQNFRPIPIKVEAYYKNNQDSQLISYRIDSIKNPVNGGDTLDVLYPNRIVTESDSSSCSYVAEDTSWLGSKVDIRNNNPKIARFINNENDTIILYYLAPPGVSWKAYQIDTGGYIEATVDSQQFISLLGRGFNIRYISFQAFDSQDNKIPHIINGATIANSFSFGLIQTINFFRFPKDTTTYDLAGVTKYPPPNFNPSFDTINPKARDFFDYRLGDEFHYKIVKKNSNLATSKVTFHEKRMVIDKKWLSDTVRYKFFRARVEFDSDQNANIDSTISVDTLTKRYVMGNYSFLNKMSHELIKGDSSKSGYMKAYFYSKYNNRFIKEPIQYLTYDSATSCLTTDTSTNMPKQVFGNGLGEVYKKEIRPDSTKDILKKELVYFQKGLEQWGTSYNLNNLVSVREPELQFERIKVFPNPVETQLNLKWRGFNKSYHDNLVVTVLNLKGQKVYSRSIKASSNQLSVPFDQQEKGIYMVSITLENGKELAVRKILKN